MNVLIIGSGGHARVVADILLVSSHVEPLGFISNDSLETAGVLGLPVLGNDDTITSIPHDGVVLALGDNKLRHSLYDMYTNKGENLVSAIHPSAIIAPDVIIEPGCMICAGVVINSGSRIGRNTILNTGCTVDHDCTIAPHCHIAPGVNLAGNVTIGEETFVGIGACVVQGISVGESAVVGAGAAVIQDVAPRITVVGVPARELT